MLEFTGPFHYLLRLPIVDLKMSVLVQKVI
jgi:hypothetical protein